MQIDATYEDMEYYSIITKKDGSHFSLYGTSYTTPLVYGTEQKDSYTFIYRAENESGTWSYGEAAYDECLISV